MRQMIMQPTGSVLSPAEPQTEPRGGPQAVARFCRNVRHSEAFSADDVMHIAANLRDVDKYEALAVGNVPGTNVGLYAEHSAISAVVYYKDRPTFIAGAILTDIPGAFAIWGFGTKDTWRVLPALAKISRDRFAKYLFEERGARRLTVQLPATAMCRGNINWLKRVGFIPEGYHPFATVDGEAMLTMAVTKLDYANYVQHQSAQSTDAESCGADDSASRANKI